jgi:hypothetical protein
MVEKKFVTYAVSCFSLGKVTRKTRFPKVRHTFPKGWTVEDSAMSVPYKPPAKILDWLVGEEATRNDLKAKIAERIRRELVCCDIYDRFQKVFKELSPAEGTKYMKEHREEYQNHSLCYWGEAAAQLAEKVDSFDD